MPNNQASQPNKPLKDILWEHKAKLEQLRKILFFGENRQNIQKANINLFETDLRKMIEELEELRTEKNISLFIKSVDAIQEKVSDIVDKLTLAASTFGSKQADTALKKRLDYFKECRSLLKEALEQFMPALNTSEIKKDDQSA